MTARSRSCDHAGRDPADLRVAVALREQHPSEAGRLAQLGVDELVLVTSPPRHPALAGDGVVELAEDWQ